MRKTLLPAVCCCLLLILTVSANGSADPIRDAYFSPPVVNMSSHLSDLTRAQTFTVGLAGQLTGFDVLLSTPASFTTGSRVFEIHATDASGLPVFGSTALASATVSYWKTSGSTFFHADITAAMLFVTPGEVYAIVDPGVPGSSFSMGWWDGRFYSSLYPDGEAYSNRYTDLTHLTNPSNSYRVLDEYGSDLGFQTWIDTEGAPAIPEPATLLLLGGGLVGLAVRRRGTRP